ncbi:MAG: MFS transporter, partial [Burkholderiales bacterium]|nr:MFS transporter [Burkholderiales bacterium]
MDKINIRPWRWVPTTYFMQGLPFSLIVIVSTIMYKNFKLNNSDITFYTGWFFIPWIVKPIWAWFIDLYQTKRWWIFLMEILLGVGFFTIAMSLQFSNYFIISLALFWLCAFFSASHDIATDGFYLITLKDDQQSFFVGMQSLFSQAARFFAGGLLVMLSGILIQHYALSPYLSWSICFIIAAVVALCIGLYNFFVLPGCEIKHQQPKNNLLEIKTIFIDFFKLKQIWLTLLFIM